MSKNKASMFLYYWRLVVNGGDIAEPTPEYRFYPSRKWRFDFAFPAERVAVEVEGNAWHVNGGGRHMQDSDLEKYNMAAIEGWRILRFSPKMLKDNPVDCIGSVMLALYGTKELA